jgi:hypothetical protein
MFLERLLDRSGDVPGHIAGVLREQAACQLPAAVVVESPSLVRALT